MIIKLIKCCEEGVQSLTKSYNMKEDIEAVWVLSNVSLELKFTMKLKDIYELTR